MIREFFTACREDALDWCRKQPWMMYAIWPPYFLWLLGKEWYYIFNADQYWGARTWFTHLDLGIHELGHFVFRPFGELMMYAGGSLLQCLVPFCSAFGFLRQRHFYAVGIMGAWLSVNLFEVATYMADADVRQLPLVSPGVGAVSGGEAAEFHDWYNILGQLRLLKHDDLFAGVTRLAATGVMIASLWLLCWLVWRMIRPVQASRIVRL